MSDTAFTALAMQCSSSDAGLPAQLDLLCRGLHPLTGSEDPVPGSRRAAVLVLLFDRGKGVEFLLTERPQTLPRHPGQISLPGGAADPGDPNLWETALRETREEMGIDTATLVPLGRLPDIHVHVSGYTVTPFVAWAPKLPPLSPDPSEVAQIIDIPLAELLDPNTVRTETWDFAGTQRAVTYYLLAGHIVWGATARILSHLARSLGIEFMEQPPGSVE